MKLVILAGGLGTRLSEETGLRPKPMVEIGGRPIIWHIMKQYLVHGVDEFIICCGYKGYMIKEYFSNYLLHMSDVCIDPSAEKITFQRKSSEPWRITLVDTGEHTMTGGRLKRVQSYVDEDESFCLTYGDGVSDVDISGLIQYHKSHGKTATVTAVHPPSRFGVLRMQGDEVLAFSEKPQTESDWINGGFFVLNRGAFAYLDKDSDIWEREPLESIARDGQLRAWRHEGFWQPMDTLRDKHLLEELWAAGNAPWKTW